MIQSCFKRKSRLTLVCLLFFGKCCLRLDRKWYYGRYGLFIVIYTVGMLVEHCFRGTVKRPK